MPPRSTTSVLVTSELDDQPKRHKWHRLGQPSLQIQVGPHFGLTWTTWGVRVSISCIRVDMQTDIAPLVDIAVERALYVRLRVKVTSTVDSAIVVALNARLSIVLKGAVRTDLLQMLPDILRIIMRKVMPIEHRFDDVRPFYDDVGNRVALDTHNVEMLLVNQEDYDMLTELDVRSVEIHVVDDRFGEGDAADERRQKVYIYYQRYLLTMKTRHVGLKYYVGPEYFKFIEDLDKEMEEQHINPYVVVLSKRLTTKYDIWKRAENRVNVIDSFLFILLIALNDEHWVLCRVSFYDWNVMIFDFLWQQIANDKDKIIRLCRHWQLMPLRRVLSPLLKKTGFCLVH
ncbi:hypothetical protein PTKIN_Ptkin02bG0131600 [Pterospermum kingtungense]